MTTFRFATLFFLLLLAAPQAFSAKPAPSPSVSLTPAQALTKWCKDVQVSVKKLGWDVPVCGEDARWKQGGTSVEGRPLLYAEYGDPNATNVTLIFALVHGDENTPLYIGLKLSHWLKENEKVLKNTRVILAPMVNPDGFFHVPKRRMNANGVDVNRNFDTSDWQASALRSWAIKYRKDPRRYPGNEPRSEPETVFQEDLIKQYKPQKIISIHSPLNFLDYDGPSAASMSLEKFPQEYVQQCLRLRKRVKAISSGFFPGSLGNYAGQEKGIPTLTLELPTADPHKAEAYWHKFSEGIRTAIEFQMDSHAAAGM
jgi:protein MpaA